MSSLFSNFQLTLAMHSGKMYMPSSSVIADWNWAGLKSVVGY